MTQIPERLKALRHALATKKIDAWMVPNADAYFNEYLPESEQRLQWLTGFTGSAGFAVIAAEKAAFFTDGRYVLQAEKELDPKLFSRHNIREKSPQEWVCEQPDIYTIACDPWLVSISDWKRWDAALKKVDKALMASSNVVDGMWLDRPDRPQSEAFLQPPALAGKTLKQKVTQICDLLKQEQVRYYLLTQPDSVCWLLNIRGEDVPHVPFFLAYAMLDAEKETVHLFADPERLNKIRKKLPKNLVIQKPDQLKHVLQDCSAGPIGADADVTPVAVELVAATVGRTLVHKKDPCQLPKAMKNAVELDGLRVAHRRDAVAVIRSLIWLEKGLRSKKSITELDVMRTLYENRAAQQHFWDTSFETICGSGPNGAIIHYRATEKSHSPILRNTLLLIDSGGNYRDGTTDITRTIAIGRVTREMKLRFTEVLKGHIALASVVFPVGVNGAQLDSLARQFLWKQGLDYDHGTGHGVGAFLSVHEGPQRISKHTNVTLQQGMILSNEPGYYKPGAFGIRIENLVTVVPAKQKRFLKFETLTLVPIDRNVIEFSLLTYEERQWLNEYHAQVWKLISPKLTAAEKQWLKKATKAF